MSQTPTNTLTRQRLQQLAEEATALAEWTVVRDWAAQMYGEDRAAKVQIDVYAQYNDETYDYPIGAITVHDKEGHELDPDYALPFFQTKPWQTLITKSYYDEEDNIADVLENLGMTDEEKRRGGWILLEDLPNSQEECSETYDLTKEPSLTLPVIA